MGSSTANKRSRKFAQRHLRKERTQRKKTQFVNKQRAEQDAKLQKAVRLETERNKELAAKKTSEQRVRQETEDFLRKTDPVTECDSDLEEIADDDERGIEGSAAFDKEIRQDVDFLPLDKASQQEEKSSSEDELDEEGVEEQIYRYRKQLSHLKDVDPEFHQYLQKADEQLLQFQLPSDDEVIDSAPPAASHDDVRELNEERIDQWCADVLSAAPNVESLRFLMTAYAFACQYGEETENATEDTQHLMQFSSSTVYSKLMIFVLKEADSIFRTYLALHKKKQIKRNDILKATKEHPDVAMQLHRFLVSSCCLLRQLLEDNILSFVLRKLRSFVVLMEGMPTKIPKLFIRAALEIFSSASPAPRLQSVLLIREMVLHHGENTVHLCLKGVYKSFLSSCTAVNQQTLPQLHFMGTCVIELYSLSPECAYQNAFKFIRDLAIDLREAIIAKDRDAAKKVFCWRFVHGLELWARLISALLDKGDMQQLVYPVAQLLTGAARFQDHMRHLPMRLRLVAAANRLSEATGVFIPVSSLLIGILSWSYLQKKPTMTGNEKCPNIAVCLAVDEKTLKNSLFQSEVVEQVIELLAQHMAPFSHTISFPETSHWITVQLKRFAKSVHFPSYKSSAMQLTGAIKSSSERVLARRMLVGFSPRDVEQVEQFNLEGKAAGKSALEVLHEQLVQRRQQRQSLQTADAITLQEPISAPAEKEKHKNKKTQDVTLSDAETLTSDEGELREEELEGLDVKLPAVEDILEDYILSEDEAEVQNVKRRKLESCVQLPKQKRRKEKKKTLHKVKQKSQRKNQMSQENNSTDVVL